MGIESLYLLLFLISLFLAAFFCSAETAFIGMQKLRLQHLLRMKHPNAKIVAKIMERPEKFLATVLLAINFFETAVATLGTLMAISLWGENLGAAIATIVVTILTLVVAELIPKSIAARYGEKIALAYARPIEFISTIFYPFTFVLNRVGIRFTRLWEEEGPPRPTISEDEFHTAITIGHREGTIEEHEAEMLHNVFDFGDRPVREVMVPRPEVVFIEEGATLADFLSLYAQHPVSRIPVFRDNRDHVIGTLSSKDVLVSLASETAKSDTVIDGLVRPAYFTPESKPVSELFAEMRDHGHRMAVVIDEFGGTAGVVSINQMIEEIIGPIGDGQGNLDKDYEIINDYTFQIDGSMRVEEVNEEMELGLPEGDYETVAGFVLHLLRRMPKQGEQLKYKDLKLVITRMQGMKIEEVLVTKERSPQNAEKEPKEKDAASAG